MCEILVSELKKELFNLTLKSDEEECKNNEAAYLAIHKMGKKIDDRFNIDVMVDGYVGECVKGKDISERIKKKSKSKEDEVKIMLKEKREEEEKRKENVESEEESVSVESMCESDWDWDSSDDESEDECGKSLGKLFDD